MKALLSQKYLLDFDMKILIREVNELFDNYNFICELVDRNEIIDNKNSLKEFNSNNFANSIQNKTIEKIESYISYIQKFNRKLEHLKTTLTEDELTIFKYSIEERESDKIICDRICKTYKTYYNIKKSCFVKVALKFNLSVDAVNSTLERTFQLNENI